ncbi:MAG: ATP-binding protein [Synergistes jonesii]|uniref:ATP-binding protein n=1 Tax=Synergistes jonesii TaxID=2754 RepID=UPI002A758F59|nr:ATP-binding protein [Synergistes jonesii]MDY2984729.1 ATP-binding protein [Synergistes jonesii]
MSLIKDKQLSYDRLRRVADIEALGFKTTKGIDKLTGLIGQERAVRSVDFGLSVQSKGYNIFVVGEPGCGRTTYMLSELRREAEKMPAPDDWVYVYNFDDPSQPLAVNLPAGRGRELAKDADNAIEELKTALSKAFDNSEFEDSKAQLVKTFQEEVNKIMEDLRKWAEEKNFSIKRTPQGFVNLPLIMAPPLPQTESENAQPAAEPEAKKESDGDEKPQIVRREMQQEEFEKLSEEQQQALQKVSEEISQKTLEKLRVIREREKELKEKIKELEGQICKVAVTPITSELSAKYAPNEKLSKWFDEFTEDISANFNVFLASARDESAEIDFTRYEVNAFVSNDPKGGAPVISETNPIYYNLVGKVDYENKQGNLYSTDFRHILPGAMHRANGGFLLLDADELLRQFMSWDVLKRVLRYRELSIENLGEQLGYIPVSTLKPEPIPIDMKVVIVGTPYLYYLLNIYDPEFGKVFKIKAEFDSEMPRTPQSEYQIAQFIAGFVEHEGGLNFTAAAVGEVIEWSSRLAEDRNKLSTKLNKIAETLVEATAYAKAGGKKLVGVEDVRRAIEEKLYRVSMWESKVLEEYRSGVIRIDTEGSVVGQINGLTVSQLIDNSFGSPVRITANVFMGEPGVVNIEREVSMTGPIHNKGLMILSSYLGRMYARNYPLSIAARITFEQTYGGVEGDSASSTELYCLLSAISGIPLNQSIAVTGSVDQQGNIQPIGGVNEKIEGFFRYCKARGLTGRQGVMIPFQNEQHLMLSHEVVDAVKKNKFHIWSISTIDEGIEILTGVKAGEPDENGAYPKNSVHGSAQAELEAWVERSFRYKKVMNDRVDPPKKSKRKAAKEAVIEASGGI